MPDISRVARERVRLSSRTGGRGEKVRANRVCHPMPSTFIRTINLPSPRARVVPSQLSASSEVSWPPARRRASPCLTGNSNQPTLLLRLGRSWLVCHSPLSLSLSLSPSRGLSTLGAAFPGPAVHE